MDINNNSNNTVDKEVFKDEDVEGDDDNDAAGTNLNEDDNENVVTTSSSSSKTIIFKDINDTSTDDDDDDHDHDTINDIENNDINSDGSKKKSISSLVCDIIVWKVLPFITLLIIIGSIIFTIYLFQDSKHQNNNNNHSTNNNNHYVYTKRGQPKTKEEQNEMIKLWGKWSLDDSSYNDIRNIHNNNNNKNNDFYKDYPNRDIPFKMLPKHSWQLNTKYLNIFLKEGKELIIRSMEAILSEYGFGIDTVQEEEENNLSFEERSKMFELLYSDNFDNIEKMLQNYKNDPNLNNDQGGWTTKSTWDSLKRRLLHSIITEDTFIVAMGGASAAAGHGNHFVQSYMMQVQLIMEPIFARLGVKHQSRNFGMGGLGTAQNSIAAHDIYGPDVDILIWDSAMTESGPEFSNLFARHAIMNDDNNKNTKVPILWNLLPVVSLPLNELANVDIGSLGTSMIGIKQSESIDDIDNTIWAAKYIKCSNEIQHPICRSNQYNGTCWIQRNDIQPLIPQRNELGGHASWHPGNRIHQLKGRSFSFMLLKALYEVLTEWSNKDNFILSDDVWHITDYYNNIRTSITNIDPSLTGGCSTLEDNGVGYLCKIPFKGRTEFTPRAYPTLTSIRSLMPPEMSMYMPLMESSIYDPPDVFNPRLHPPSGEIDVLSIIESGSNFIPIRNPSYTDYYETPTHQLTKFGNTTIPGKGIGIHTSLANHDFCDGTYDSWCGRGIRDDCLLYGHNDGRNGLLFDSYSGWIMLTIPKVKYGYIILKLETWHPKFENPRTIGWTYINNEDEETVQEVQEEDEDDSVNNNNVTVGGQNSNMTQEEAEQQQHEVINNIATEGQEHDTNITIDEEQNNNNITFVEGQNDNNNTGEVQNKDGGRRRQRRRVLYERPEPYCDDFRFEYSINGNITSLTKDEFEERKAQIQRVVELVPILEDPNYTNGKEEDIAVAIRIVGCGRLKTFSLTHIYWA